jgi:hypothetical protein
MGQQRPPPKQVASRLQLKELDSFFNNFFFFFVPWDSSVNQLGIFFFLSLSISKKSDWEKKKKLK